MRIDPPTELPRVMADERCIVQVLNNLFSNAARHARESSPIHIEAVFAGIEVAVSVTDEGRSPPVPVRALADAPAAVRRANRKLFDGWWLMSGKRAGEGPPRGAPPRHDAAAPMRREAAPTPVA